MGDLYRIRLVERADLASIAVLEERCFSDPWPAAAFAGLLGSLSLTAVADTELVGYVFARVMSTEAGILNVAVHPEHRERGLGMRLVAESLDRCRRAGAESVFLEVRESNRRAIGLYEKMGFRTLHRRRRYYRNPAENALILGRDLGP